MDRAARSPNYDEAIQYITPSTDPDETRFCMRQAGMLRCAVSAITTRVSDLEDENRRLAAFGRQIIEYAFNGTDADGGSIQALALTHGLLRLEAYDLEKHGASLAAEPGDEWFVCVGAVADAPAE